MIDTPSPGPSDRIARIDINVTRLNEIGHKVDNTFRIVADISRKVDRLMTQLQDDMAALKTAVGNLITAFQAAQSNVAAAVSAAVAADEAGTDVDVKALASQINAAMAPAAAAVTAAAPAAAPASAPAA